MDAQPPSLAWFITQALYSVSTVDFQPLFFMSTDTWALTGADPEKVPRHPYTTGGLVVVPARDFVRWHAEAHPEEREEALNALLELET